MLVIILLDTQKDKDNLEALDVSGSIIFIWILEKQCVSVWIAFIRLGQRRYTVDMIMNFTVP
jgi:hypothetical protein